MNCQRVAQICEMRGLQINGRLGIGSEGNIYSVSCNSQKEEVALKVLKIKKEAAFSREIEIWQKLNTLSSSSSSSSSSSLSMSSPSITSAQSSPKSRLPKFAARLTAKNENIKAENYFVQLHRAFFIEKYGFLVMEKAEFDLMDYLIWKKQIDENEAKFIFSKICTALQLCHQNSIAHLDIKPENILIFSSSFSSSTRSSILRNKLHDDDDDSNDDDDDNDDNNDDNDNFHSIDSISFDNKKHKSTSLLNNHSMQIKLCDFGHAVLFSPSSSSSSSSSSSPSSNVPSFSHSSPSSKSSPYLLHSLSSSSSADSLSLSSYSSSSLISSMKITNSSSSPQQQNKSPVTKIENKFKKIGTKEYRAPELCRSSLNRPSQVDATAADIWSLGVMLFVVLTGYFPFCVYDKSKFDAKQNKQRICRETENTITIMNVELIKNFASEDCFDLLNAMLQENPDNRLTIDEVLRHRWFSSLKKKKSFSSLFK